MTLRFGSGFESGSISTRSDVHRRSSSMAAIVYGVEDYRSTAHWGAERGNARGKWSLKALTHPVPGVFEPQSRPEAVERAKISVQSEGLSGREITPNFFQALISAFKRPIMNTNTI